ncbi:MAG: tetratricopeptide repeat protein [Planctomycetes bacterium]|nr:tetratricopeptide repeat protein [Planctomycetota bacterium]
MANETPGLDVVDREIAITGRLASMTRSEAIRRIRDAGGRYVRTLGDRPGFLVVGEDGPPLSADGELPAIMRRTREGMRAGAPLEIVRELEFLRLLGLEEHGESLSQLYTPAHLSRIVGVPAHRLRSWVRHGLLQPRKIIHRLLFFDFRQVTWIKSLHELTRKGVAVSRLRKSLRELAEWYPDSVEALAKLEALEQGDGLVVRLENGRLAEPNGQLVLDFISVDEGDVPMERPEGSLHRLASVVVREGERQFQRGLNAEADEDWEAAREAYAQAIAEGEEQPEIHFNLGNVLYKLARFEEAEAHFVRATELEPEFVEAWNNLGNARSDLGRLDDAIEAYRHALAIEPHYEDGHYNLALALASTGDVLGARRHWNTYLRYDPDSSWACEVRELLRKVEESLGGR